MKYYVKVTKQMAKEIIKSGVPLTMTSDGNCLLYQSELNGVKGKNLRERATNVGGSLVEEYSALAEIKGTAESPAYCYTPVEYGGEGDTRDKDKHLNTGSAPGSEAKEESKAETKGESVKDTKEEIREESEVTNE